MTEHFNKLTEAEQERLVLLMEECSEVIQACSKILRHGYESMNYLLPGAATNRADLEREIGDMLSCVRRLELKNDIEVDTIGFGYLTRIQDKERFLHHQ